MFSRTEGFLNNYFRRKKFYSEFDEFRALADSLLDFLCAKFGCKIHGKGFSTETLFWRFAWESFQNLSCVEFIDAQTGSLGKASMLSWSIPIVFRWIVSDASGITLQCVVPESWGVGSVCCVSKEEEQGGKGNLGGVLFALGAHFCTEKAQHRGSICDNAKCSVLFCGTEMQSKQVLCISNLFSLFSMNFLFFVNLLIDLEKNSSNICSVTQNHVNIACDWSGFWVVTVVCQNVICRGRSEFFFSICFPVNCV